MGEFKCAHGCMHPIPCSLPAPIRVSPGVHVIHTLLPPWCRLRTCPKNHINFFSQVESGHAPTMHANLILIHYKGERKAGPATLLVAPGLVPTLLLLEKASNQLAPDSPSIFINKQYHGLYSEAHWSMEVTACLSTCGHHITARAMRHAFSTNWRDFMDNPKLSLDMATAQVEAAAAYYMGNTTAAWDATYDDNIRIRAKQRVLQLYPQFVAWVRAQAARQVQQQPIDPLA